MGTNKILPLQHMSDEYTSMLIRKIDLANIQGNSMKVKKMQLQEWA